MSNILLYAGTLMIFAITAVALFFVISKIIRISQIMQHRENIYRNFRDIEMALSEVEEQIKNEESKKYINAMEEQIRLTAYYMWETAGMPHGKDKEFWKKAEEEYHRKIAFHYWARAAERKAQDEELIFITI